jgi:hypothetical protein
VEIQQSGWIGLHNPYALTLTRHGGLHRIQVWVADGAGNISLLPAVASINYLPASDSLKAGQIRIYRWPMAAGQVLNATLETQSGDADLYIWPPCRHEPVGQQQRRDRR